MNASPRFHAVRSLPFCLYYDLWPFSPRTSNPCAHLQLHHYEISALSFCQAVVALTKMFVLDLWLAVKWGTNSSTCGRVRFKVQMSFLPWLVYQKYLKSFGVHSGFQALEPSARLLHHFGVFMVIFNKGLVALTCGVCNLCCEDDDIIQPVVTSTKWDSLPRLANGADTIPKLWFLHCSFLQPSN